MDDLQLNLSGIQHFAFCPRQWALIHIEQQWADNSRTASGNIFHERAHDGSQRQLRGDTLILRGLRVFSRQYRISGVCDVVEFHRTQSGIHLQGEEGFWLPYPVQYKRGEPKANDADRLQLCAQAVCLEQMLACHIPEGALFYGEIRRRQIVSLDQPLRDEMAAMLSEMHRCFKKGYTPKARKTKGCKACSLQDECLPETMKCQKTSEYILHAMEDSTQ